jgi:hypothetical protein
MAQERLFDLPDKGPDTRHPGQLPYVEWLKRPDTAHHASFREDWEQSPQHVHLGTQAAASDRLLQQAKNITPGENERPQGGRIWARRMTEAPVAHVRDSSVGQAESAIRWPSLGEPGQHASEDQRPEIQATHAHMTAGRTVSYKNYAEDTDSTSFVAPTKSLRSWHQDVAEAQSLGLDVHPHDVSLAKQQFDPAISITPKSMRSNVEGYVNRYEGRADQLSMFPASVKHPAGGEQLVASKPSDRDTDNWGSRHPGSDALRRARAIATTTGQDWGFGVRAQAKEPDLPNVESMERAHHSVLEEKKRQRRQG